MPVVARALAAGGMVRAASLMSAYWLPAAAWRPRGGARERVADDARACSGSFIGSREGELRMKHRFLSFHGRMSRSSFWVCALLAWAVFVTLFVGIGIALARWIGPLGGAVASTLLAAGIAGLLVWLALRDLKEDR